MRVGCGLAIMCGEVHTRKTCGRVAYMPCYRCKATITPTLNNRGGMTGIAAETADCSDIYNYEMLDSHLADLKEFAADLAGTYPWDDEEFKVEFGALKSEDDEEIVWDATITKL